MHPSEIKSYLIRKLEDAHEELAARLVEGNFRKEITETNYITGQCKGLRTAASLIETAFSELSSDNLKKSEKE